MFEFRNSGSSYRSKINFGMQPPPSMGGSWKAQKV